LLDAAVIAIIARPQPAAQFRSLIFFSFDSFNMIPPHKKLALDLARRYTLSRATYLIGKHRLEIFSIANSYELLDELSEEAMKDEVLPYWAEIWPCSFVLAEFIMDDLPMPEKHCLELGAGVGLVSVAAAKAGAHILATDYAPEAMEFIRLNSWQNEVFVKAERMDWRDIRLTDNFDFIFAADVLYERRNLLPVVLAVDKLLRPDGAAYIADPRREIAKDFLALASENNFKVEVYSKPLQTSDRLLNIDIYELKKYP